MMFRTALAALVSVVAFTGTTYAADADDAGIRALLTRVEEALRTGNLSAFLDLHTPSADRDRAAAFRGSEFPTGATRAVAQLRDRDGLADAPPGYGYRIVVDTFVELGPRARISTWQLDITKLEDGQWRIANERRLSSLESLYRLSVNQKKQFAARDFTIHAEDLDLTLDEGSVFMIDTDQGTAGLVLLGRGEMRFRPASDTERGQVKIFTGSETLRTRFDAAYIRLGSLSKHADPSQLIERTVDPRELRRAEQVFREESVKSFALDLADLTRENWSLLLGAGEFLAEVRTRRFDTLTYAKAGSEAEDISLFDRKRRRNISVYPSASRLAARGRFYNEDELAAYDVLDYHIDVALSPERQWLEGRTKVRLKIRSNPVAQLTLKLADSLIVQSVTSERWGRLFSFRAVGQNSMLVNLPALLMPDTDVSLTIAYAGRLPPQPTERESLGLGQTIPRPFPQTDSGRFEEALFPQPEASFLYSNRSYWYPQAPSGDYATATIRITVPAAFDCVASGELSPESTTLPGKDASASRKLLVFTATKPLRYFSFLVTRLPIVDRVTIGAGKAPSSGSNLDVTVAANPRLLQRARDLTERLIDVQRFYQSIVGEVPYPSFTLAVIENFLPGGHSPGYFAVLNEPLPGIPVVWRNDPAAFNGFPEFFLAHEVAHQWWGQAVGWRNYHEQWLSEGFAQYFAALYAQHRRGDETFASMLRQMRKWSLDASNQGPIYLGYRLGHILSDGRVFRALIYNKGGAVLHMLRRLIGDEPFFSGIRRFYDESRFKKAGTDDLQRAMETESGRSLERFFDRWIYKSALPRLKFSYRLEPAGGPQEVVLRIEQVGDVFDLPVTVTLQYVDRKPVDVVVPVTEQVVEMRVRLDGMLRSADVSKDDGTLADVQRF